MIDSIKLGEAAQNAKRLNVSLDKAITMLKCASEINLKIAMQANEMVLKGKLELQLAIKALQLAKQNGIEFDDALNVMGTLVHKTQQTPSLGNALADLLLTSKLITSIQTAQIIQQSRDTQMSIGRTLIVNRMINRFMLQEALAALALIKEDKVDAYLAKQALQTALQRRVGVLQVLFESGDYNDCSGETLKLSELLVMAGSLGEGDLFDCLEDSLCHDRPFGQVMLDHNLITLPILEAACSLLDMVGSYLKPFQAAEALKKCAPAEFQSIKQSRSFSRLLRCHKETSVLAILSAKRGYHQGKR